MTNPTNLGITPPADDENIANPTTPVRPLEPRHGVWVGIGCSAGGLEALDAFFRSAPPDAGIIWIVVQHLSPTHKALLPELLQRATPMPVKHIVHGMAALPNHVHVLPPRYDLTVSNGHFCLHEIPTKNHLVWLPIDRFFMSLAETIGENAAAVVLSGMGTDGTEGAKAIQQHSGAVFAQLPQSAKYESMPANLLASLKVDGCASPETLPGCIEKWIHHMTSEIPQWSPHTLHSNQELTSVLEILHHHTGHDFSVYKKSTLMRRVERRMSLQHLGHGMAAYTAYLRESPQERDLLFREMLIGVTEFFRDEALWTTLRDKILPDMIRSRPAGHEMRAWVAGCSTGEEAYSLAMIFTEARDLCKPTPNVTLQIFASDLDTDAIDRARAGIYPQTITKHVSEERLKRFFTRVDHRYRVRKEIREMVVFAKQNIVSDAPFIKLDLLSCRNLLIYFESYLQRKLLPLFHYCLNPGGILMLGTAETIGSSTELFSAAVGKNRLYRRLESAPQLGKMHFPVAFQLSSEKLTPSADSTHTAMPHTVPDLQSFTNDFMLRLYSPAAVMVTENGDILYIHGKTGKYLEPAAGRANWNLFAMAREELNPLLYEVFQRALHTQESAHSKDPAIVTSHEHTAIQIDVHPLSSVINLKDMLLVVFSEVPTPNIPSASTLTQENESTRVREVTRELRKSKKELQVLREEMQTTSEELKASNEELQSANEELQSMNEELTTSKEEMQAMNEELQVVNQDLLIKIQDLSRTNNDMENLLNSTDIATLFLDNDLNVRWFAPKTAEIIHLIPSDVGRPVTDLVSRLEYPELTRDAREVLRSLIPHHLEIPSLDGRWYATRIIPYRTRESMIDGIVITFHEITEIKKIESQLLAARTLPAEPPASRV